MTTDQPAIQGGETVIRQNRAANLANLADLERQADQHLQQVRRITLEAELIQAAIDADTAIINRLARLARAEQLAANKPATTPTPAKAKGKT